MTSLASVILCGKAMPLDLAHARAPSPTKKLQMRQISVSPTADIIMWISPYEVKTEGYIGKNES